MFSFDLPGAFVALYIAWRRDKEFQAWLKLILSTAYSGFLGLAGGMGGSLVTNHRVPIALGYGLIGAAVSVLTVLLRSPQARSLLLAVPREVIEPYQKAEGETVIEPVGKGK